MQKEKYLPNVRRLFKPDPGFTLFDIDLSGADAAVVAWEANDQELKDAFMSGMKLHSKNYELLWEKPFDPLKDKRVKPAGWNYPPYDAMKRFVHGTNYGASARTIAITLGWKIADAEACQSKWFRLHPGIRSWQERVGFDIQTKRTVRNKFGYRIPYLDRPDALLPQGLAWIPQSTVGILCSKAGIKLDRECNRSCVVPQLRIETLIQAHDALIFQIPSELVTPENLQLIKSTVSIPIPYDDPLLINWSIASSTISWADCKSISWDGSSK
jgi:DNA polymerase I-like protein with 3'-5' exonuclease and polymerase domains